MSRGSNHVKIDTEYLSEIVKKSGLTHREFGASVGRTESLVHKAKQRGYLQRPCAELICKIHGADINRLILPETPVEIEPKKPDATMQSVETIAKALIRIEKKIDLILSCSK